MQTIAFPCISTSIYGYPFEQACRIALDTIIAFLSENHVVEQVTLVCFSKSDYDRYAEIVKEAESK